MPKASSKKKTAEPTSWSGPGRLREKVDSLDLGDGDGDDDGLFVLQSPPLQARIQTRTKPSKPTKPQRNISRMNEGDGSDKMDYEKYEKAQRKRATVGRKPNKAFNDFEKMVTNQSVETEKEIRDVRNDLINSEQSFSTTFHSTLKLINNDGFSSIRTAENCHCIRDASEKVLSKARALVQDYRSSLLVLSSIDIVDLVKATQNDRALDVQHTETILESGVLVGDDRINHKLSGHVQAMHDPGYTDASKALFAEKSEDETKGDSWARVAKDQGRIVKRMVSSIAE